ADTAPRTRAEGSRQARGRRRPLRVPAHGSQTCRAPIGVEAPGRDFLRGIDIEGRGRPARWGGRAHLGRGVGAHRGSPETGAGRTGQGPERAGTMTLLADFAIRTSV